MTRPLTESSRDLAREFLDVLRSAEDGAPADELRVLARIAAGRMARAAARAELAQRELEQIDVMLAVLMLVAYDGADADAADAHVTALLADEAIDTPDAEHLAETCATLVEARCADYRRLYEQRPPFGFSGWELGEEAAHLALGLARRIGLGDGRALSGGGEPVARARAMLRSLCTIAGAAQIDALARPEALCGGAPTRTLPGPELPEWVGDDTATLWWSMTTELGAAAAWVTDGYLDALEQPAAERRDPLRQLAYEQGFGLELASRIGEPFEGLPEGLRGDRALAIVQTVTLSALVAQAEGLRAPHVLRAEEAAALREDPALLAWGRRAITESDGPAELDVPRWRGSAEPLTLAVQEALRPRVDALVPRLLDAYETVYDASPEDTDIEATFAIAAQGAALVLEADATYGRTGLDAYLDQRLSLVRRLVWSTLAVIDDKGENHVSPVEFRRVAVRWIRERERAEHEDRARRGLGPTPALTREVRRSTVMLAGWLAILVLAAVSLVLAVLWATGTTPDPSVAIVLAAADQVAAVLVLSRYAAGIADGMLDVQMAMLRRLASQTSALRAAAPRWSIPAVIAAVALAIVFARVATDDFATAVALCVPFALGLQLLRSAIYLAWFWGPIRRAAADRVVQLTGTEE